MKKELATAKNIICGKEVKVEVVSIYSDTQVEVRVAEGQFKGTMAIVNNCDITKHEVELSMEDQVIELCNNMDLEYSNGVENEIVIEGMDYTIYINIDEEEKTFDMSTLNRNINWDAKCDNDIYFDMSDAYKNAVCRKTLTAVKSYIEKYN